MASDRAESVKKAEKLLRQGKLDLAIAEYVRMVEEQPRDWNGRNTLGDLYVRANQLDKAVAQYEHIADHLFSDGFFPKAAALYKKILKLKPNEESVQLHLAEICAKQGLLADAKGYFVAVATRRRARGDRAGADEIVVRLGSLDPADFDARSLAANTLERNGDAPAAAALYRAMHDDLLEKKRPEEAANALREVVRLNPGDVEARRELVRSAVAKGDLESAAPYLDRTIAGDDPELLLPLLERELRAGRIDAGRDVLMQLLRMDPALRGRIIELAWTLGPDVPDASFACIDGVVDVELAASNYMDAAAILQEFVTRVSGQIAALLRLVEISVDGGLEAIMYEAQAHLADAYLERGQGTEARVIAEDLVAREPWEHAHIDRFRRALVLLDVADPDAVIAERLSGHGPFVATDPFMAAESLNDPQPFEPEAIPVDGSEAIRADEAAAPPVEPAAPRADDVRVADASLPAEGDIPLRPRVPGPDISLVPKRPQPAAGAGKKDSTGDVDLTDVLAGLRGREDRPQRPAVPPPAQSLDAVFREFRSQASKHAGSNDAAEYLGLGKAYIESGMTKEAISALRAAARAPNHRFEAASMLGRLYHGLDDIPHAVEWLERAAQAPAPDPSDVHELLYDLGSILESAGETSRALAVLLELQSEAPEYRDVASRVERLTRVQTGS